jgi:hypothetical protein
MIIKKLAVPFINEKLLQQVEHCYIATAAISEAGFDFIRSRIPPKTKMEIITGLELPTSPAVLQRIWRNYQGRITLNIYTRNDFHANVYIFDLPFRKSVAFVGSGHFTLEGIKDSEELTSRGMSKIIIPTVYREDYMGALRKLTRQRVADTYVKMLLRAYEFSSTLLGESIDQMERYLIECDAFKEPKEGKLKILERDK